jgi:anthranilate synthase component 2
MRYHSLLVEALPPGLLATAWSADDGAGTELMAIRHSAFPVHGVQFHPESIGTPEGMAILANFLRMTGGPTPVA